MRRLSILMQVALVIAGSAFIAQVILIGLLFLSPPPEARRMTVADALGALSMPPDQLTSAGFARHVAAARPDTNPASATSDRLIAASIAAALHRPDDSVVIRTLGQTKTAKVTIIPMQSGAGGLSIANTTARTRNLASLRLPGISFPSFEVGLHQPDGRWLTIRPLEVVLTPWRLRVLAAFALSLALVGPLAWWCARSLTRPVRLFAKEAERIGLDPDAAPLIPTGPREILIAARSINTMQERLRDYVRERSAMAVAIAHDLRTPLTGLRLSVEALPTAQRERMAGDIRRMEAMIAQSLAFSRQGAEREPFEPMDLAEIAELCVADARARGHGVTLTGDDSLPVMGRPLDLSRAIDNLIENAATYAGAVEVRVGRRASHAQIVVRDHGSGIDERRLSRVFEPFYRIEPSRSRVTGGAGLGLPSARAVVRAHAGEISLHNRENGGLDAIISIPLSIG